MDIHTFMELLAFSYICEIIFGKVNLKRSVIFVGLALIFTVSEKFIAVTNIISLIVYMAVFYFLHRDKFIKVLFQVILSYLIIGLSMVLPGIISTAFCIDTKSNFFSIMLFISFALIIVAVYIIKKYILDKKIKNIKAKQKY